MQNNDILRRLRYALDLSDALMQKLMELGGLPMERTELQNLFKRETEDGFTECSDQTLAALLNGLITERRGARQEAVPLDSRLDNNMILKKLRIGLSLRDDDVVEVLRSDGFKLSRPEVNALYRHPGHKNFKRCGDQVLRHFLAGLAQHYRTGGGVS